MVTLWGEQELKFRCKSSFISAAGQEHGATISVLRWIFLASGISLACEGASKDARRHVH